MFTKKINLLIVPCLLSGLTFAAKELPITVQNSIRVGYDDNVYQQEDEHGTGYITDIINISAKFNFSSRTDMLLYWQPEFNYRFDADPEFVTYQDLYGRVNHAVSERMFLEVSNRLRYQDKDAQSGNVSRTDQSYFENNTMGSLDYTVSSLSQVTVGGGYKFREWDDDDYGKGIANNNFEQWQVNTSYIRQLMQNRTQAVIGLNYVDHDYEGSRGGYKATTVYGGADHIFNPNMNGNIRAGATFATTDHASGDSDNTSPYLQTGLEYNPSARTMINGTLGYSVQMSEQSVYNSQNQLSAAIGVRHDLTAKVSLSSSFRYIYSNYDSDYSRVGGLSGSAEDNYLVYSIRGSYQINRMNFIDAGYEYTDRNSDDFYDYDRNRVDIGWRLRL
jgi:hypothetical protein